MIWMIRNRNLCYLIITGLKKYFWKILLAYYYSYVILTFNKLIIGVLVIYFLYM